MKVGVLLPSRFEDPGEFLADARAMEAAGADSIWLEDGDGYDPMLALAACAAVTGKLRLGLIVPDSPSPSARGVGEGVRDAAALVAATSRRRRVARGKDR